MYFAFSKEISSDIGDKANLITLISKNAKEYFQVR